MGVAMADSPSGKIKYLLEHLENVQNENVKIHEAMVTLEETNRLLKEENDAVRDVNKQLREMIQKRPPYVPALPAPAPAPLAVHHHPHDVHHPHPHPHDAPHPHDLHPAHYGHPAHHPAGAEWWHHMNAPLPVASAENTADNAEEGEKSKDEDCQAEVALGPHGLPHPHGGHYPPAAMYADPYGYHSHGIPSHASYYQEMLQSHAKMEHDRYLEAREKIVKQAEEAQEELLQREKKLAEKEATHQQYLVEREALLQKSSQAWRRTVVPYNANEYPFRRTRFNQSRSPFAYEQSLLQKHRLDKHIEKYTDELKVLEGHRSKYENELQLLEGSRN